ncbi:MAG TPA: MFS transporter [Ignavibacteriales bacterium]|nr:MFS transporter [Ignavibacteriales bacterium]HRR17770.1 MFS transporter [Ignavibacteriales bacterium]
MQAANLKKQMLMCIIGISTVGIPLGLLGPVTVILLEQVKMPTWVNGLFVTMSYLTIFLFSPITSKLINKYGIRKIFLTGMILMLIGSVGLPVIYNLWILFLARALMGIGVTLGFVSTEVLINILSTDEKRNQNITLYIMIFSVGIAIGSSLIWTLNINQLLPYIIGFVIILLVLILSAVLLDDVKIEGHEEKKNKFQLSKFPLIGFFTALLYGFFEASIMLVLPIYGLRTGFDSNDTTILITSFVVGGIIVFYLLSKLYKGLQYFNYIRITLFITMILLLSPTIINDLWLQTLLFFLLGGFIPALYSLGLSYTMNSVDKQYTAEVNGYYSASYGLGTLLGPMLASKLLDFDAKTTYWIFSGLLSFIILAIIHGVKYGNDKNS